MLTALGALAFVVGFAGAAGGTPAAASNWHVGTYNASGRALSDGKASSSSGLATFQFTTTPDIALLTTKQGSQKGNLLGDITGKTVKATFTIAGTGPFAYYGQPDACGTPASVRLFFQTSNAGGFGYTNYWWSNISGGSLVLTNGTSLTVTATVSPEQWSDWNGQFGNTVPDGFAAAASNVTDIGLSFGGGCFFENGVGAPNETFTLNSFTVS